MALPRPIMMALAGVVLLLAAFMATRTLAGGEDPPPVVTPVPEASAAPAAKPRAGDRPERDVPPKPARARERTKDGPAADLDRRSRTAGLPVEVARAYLRGRVVLLFFHQTGGADDLATSRAVRELDKETKPRIAVFSDKLDNLADYRRLVTGLGVSQAPSIVLVKKGGGARLLEGFVDEESLHQHVADVRRTR